MSYSKETISRAQRFLFLSIYLFVRGNYPVQKDVSYFIRSNRFSEVNGKDMSGYRNRSGKNARSVY